MDAARRPWSSATSSYPGPHAHLDCRMPLWATLVCLASADKSTFSEPYVCPVWSCRCGRASLVPLKGRVVRFSEWVGPQALAVPRGSPRVSPGAHLWGLHLGRMPSVAEQLVGGWGQASRDCWPGQYRIPTSAGQCRAAGSGSTGHAGAPPGGLERVSPSFPVPCPCPQSQALLQKEGLR